MDSKKVRDILSVFYEGFFEAFSRSGRDINFKIECSYLADIIIPGSRFFYGTIKNAVDIYFIPWDEEGNEIRDLSLIESLKLDMLGAEYLYEKVKIYSNCSHTYSGGNLYIAADDVKIYDENFERLGFDRLHEIADNYWDAVNKY